MMSRLRFTIARFFSALVALAMPAPTGRLLLQVVRGAAGNHSNVLIYGSGCTDWYVLPGTEVLLGEAENGRVVAFAMHSESGQALIGPPLPGQARLFNPANGRLVSINAAGIVQLGSIDAARPAAGLGDVVTISAGAIQITGLDANNVPITGTNAAPVVGAITSGSAGAMVE